MTENTIKIRLYPAGNSEYISTKFTENLNEEALSYLHSQGIKAVLLPLPQLGGGEALSLVWKVIGYLIKAIVFLSNLFRKRQELYVDKKSPLFHIQLFSDDACQYIDWAWKDDTAEVAGAILFQGWQLASYLSNVYKNYKFEIGFGISIPKFTYRFSGAIPWERLNKASVGVLIRFTSSIQLKAHISESVEFGTWPFLCQTIQYFGADSRLKSSKILYYLIGTRSRKFTYASRRILVEKTPKGDWITGTVFHNKNEPKVK